MANTAVLVSGISSSGIAYFWFFPTTILVVLSMLTFFRTLDNTKVLAHKRLVFYLLESGICNYPDGGYIFVYVWSKN